MRNSVQRHIYTKFFGQLVGEDQFGNKYFSDKKGRRWVIYNGLAEATKVPAEWYGWLHYQQDCTAPKKYHWERDHLPNLSGTVHAHCGPYRVLNVPAQCSQTRQSWRP